MAASSTGRLSSTRWLVGFSACVLLMQPALWWSWLTPAAYGDLTRIGRFSESAFGWQGRQPAISADWLTASPVEHADVLVIGDSFSVTLRWQSVLVRAGWRVATLHWRTVNALCSDFEPSLRRLGFNGHAVVLQKAERSLPTLVDDSTGCQATRTVRSVSSPRPQPSPLTEPPPWAYQWRAPLDTGLVTAWRTWRAERDDTGFVVHDAESVRVATVPRGCELFSHRLCRRGLFLAEDLDLPAATPRHVAALPALARSTPNLRIVWAVTPNKSTIYLQPDRAAALSVPMQASVVAQGQGIDLFGALLAERERQRDLYFPNDTHFSNAGYLFMGRLIAQALGPPPSR
jgi:hypothetical protein